MYEMDISYISPFIWHADPCGSMRIHVDQSEITIHDRML